MPVVFSHHCPLLWGSDFVLPWFNVPSQFSCLGCAVLSYVPERFLPQQRGQVCQQMLGVQPLASRRGVFSHAGQTHVTCRRTSALTRAHRHAGARLQAHACLLACAPCFPHTLMLVCCNAGLMLMFPGQMWQGTVKGQSLNEPLWDLPQLLTISLQLIRQGIAALAVSLHHFLPLPFPPEPPARSTQTNQLSMKIQIGSFFLESSFSLALIPGFTDTHQPALLSASSRSVSVVRVPNYGFTIKHTPSYPDLVLTCTKKISIRMHMLVCMCSYNMKESWGHSLI